MSRMVFEGSEFEEFILKVKLQLNLTWDDLGKSVGVSGRTLRDWKRGKLLPSKKVVDSLENLSGVLAPKPIKIREEWWSGRKNGRIGALARMKKYGPVGTPEGRRKGGLMSQKRRREDPEYYRKLGCLIRKKFPELKPTAKLAELTGIILGDGGISLGQLKIYLNIKADQAYADYVRKLLGEVIGEKGSRYDYIKDSVIVLTVSGVGLIKRLIESGLKKGDKIKNQVDFPEWIWTSDKYKKLCVRGLIDTDGCLYFHHHWIESRKYKYRNLGLCYTSHSKNLITSVSKIFSEHGIKHSFGYKGGRIYVYSLGMVKKYLRIFGSSNPRITDKLQYHLSCSTRLN